MVSSEDIRFMQQAMALAQKGEGWVNPNPLVGALVVRDGEVIASGYHERYGQLHAERNAFKDADMRGIDCRGATMYVTLEPCCHHGHQPPCTEAVIQHGIKRIVVGLLDPNPLVAGKGLKILEETGIQVELIADDSEFRHQNRVFLKFITTGMPWVTAKWAMTLDGKIASHTGDSKWVSSAESRKRVHVIRKNNMAIMCGIGTVLADDPMLNVRLEPADCEGNEPPRQPIRIIADRNARLPLDSQLVRTAREIPVIVAHSSCADRMRLQQLMDAGVTLWQCEDARQILERAGKEKIDSVMVEGGGILNESLLRESLIDEVYAFIAPKIIGGQDAKTPVEGQGLALMSEAMELSNVTIEQIGSDVLIHGFK